MIYAAVAIAEDRLRQRGLPDRSGRRGRRRYGKNRVFFFLFLLTNASANYMMPYVRRSPSIK